MGYLITFLEGLVSFVSPCILPMLPVYMLYFAGGPQGSSGARTLKNALGFVLGFTVVFTALGFFAGSLGSFLARWSTVVNIVMGAVVVLFGLGYIGLFSLGSRGAEAPKKQLGFFSSAVFGAVFSVSWSPCVGAFLGSALVLASQRGTAPEGLLLLLCYSLGLGIPFLLSALLIDRLKGAFNFIKRNYRIINAVAGGLLVAMGILIMTGQMTKILSLLSA